MDLRGSKGDAEKIRGKRSDENDINTELMYENPENKYLKVLKC